jgi:IS30 family transposase
VSKLAANAELASVVAAKLDDDWSPQQIAQWLHKNADLGRFSQDQLNSVAAKLNHRPWRVLGWITPAEAFDNVQQTGMLAPA